MPMDKSAKPADSSTLSGPGLGQMPARSTGDDTVVPGPQPNILFILVDELRFPKWAFPDGVSDADGLFRRLMPNFYRHIWTKGVKFYNYYTAANACTPARGTIISGLYSQQSWLMTTIIAPPDPSPILLKQPVLNPAYPTYGKLLQKAGYQTPYRGKWHVSIPQASTGGLDSYGFDYGTSNTGTYPDPTGANLQGTYGDESLGFLNDADTTAAATKFLESIGPNSSPWCLTVSFVNPHDREFFPAGTEFLTVYELFQRKTSNPKNLGQIVPYYGSDSTSPQVPWETDALKSPMSYGYPTLPPNWESREDLKKRKKPSTQLFIREFQQGVWGGASDDPAQNGFTIQEYPNPSLQYGVAKAPFSYWQRGLDSYSQIMQIVDEQIGNVLDALPKSVKQNTVIVFASDHGEYSSAHGFLQGKLGTVYDEAWNIPLVVVDPSGRFTDDITTPRMGLASSVDLLTLLVSIGNMGTRTWMTPDLAKIYGQRLDMIPMLKSAGAAGRPYVLFATDEIAPGYYNYLNAPTHILGLRTAETKLGAYADWIPLSSTIDQRSKELEFYDYSTTDGQLELDNKPADPRAMAMFQELLNEIIPNEMQQPLPPPLRAQQLASKAAHMAYRAIIEHEPPDTWKNGGLTSILGYGGIF